jgi:hypothetical protein
MIVVDELGGGESLLACDAGGRGGQVTSSQLSEDGEAGSIRFPEPKRALHFFLVLDDMLERKDGLRAIRRNFLNEDIMLCVRRK